MDKAVDVINVESEEKNMFNELRNFLLKNLDIDKDGNIKPTIKNLKEVQRVTFIRNLLLTEDYKKKVEEYLTAFDGVAQLNREYVSNEFA